MPAPTRITNSALRSWVETNMAFAATTAPSIVPAMATSTTTTAWWARRRGRPPSTRRPMTPTTSDTPKEMPTRATVSANGTPSSAAMRPATARPPRTTRPCWTRLMGSSPRPLRAGRRRTGTHAPDGHEVTGSGRISLDLLPQAADVHGDRRCVPDRVPPHLLQQVLAAEHLAAVAHQEGQELELACRERDQTAIDPHLTRRDIHLDPPAPSTAGGTRPPRPGDCSLGAARP